VNALVYQDAVAPADANLVFGDHLTLGDHLSIAGTGGAAGISDAGDALNGQRTYMYDTSGGPDLADGFANRGDDGFAMLIWDMGQPFDSMRLYTHQDHIHDGPNTGPLGIVTDFVAQDVMEYSVWGSHDGDSFELLSDVIDHDIDGGGIGKPTHTFVGSNPTIVYRSGSEEFGEVNAYTREYVFDTAYRFYGIRTSSISLSIPDTDGIAGGRTIDADPEIDAVAAFNTADRCIQDPNDPSCVPEPGGSLLFVFGLIGLSTTRRSKR
jgi:hypothetical protein